MGYGQLQTADSLAKHGAGFTYMTGRFWGLHVDVCSHVDMNIPWSMGKLWMVLNFSEEIQE